jgi:hypothetical protein
MCIVLLSTVLSVATTSAAITVVDPTQPPQQRLAPEELEKLAQLQQPVSFPFLLSGLSPDDQAFLSVEFDQQDVHLVFSNINDGSTVAVDDRILDLPPFSELVWRDATTLTYFSTELIFNPDGSVTVGDPQ